MSEPGSETGRLEGKTALVTGASSGLGRATAKALARAGADVALVARSQKDLQSAREGISKLGPLPLLRLQALAGGQEDR